MKMSSSRSSDTIAREQQIRQSSTSSKLNVSSNEVPRQQTFQFSSETVLVIFFHVLFTIFVFGRFTMNNGALLREIFYALIDTSNETLNQPTSFSPTNY